MNLFGRIEVYKVEQEGGSDLNGAISKEEAESIFRENKDYIYKAALFLTKSRELADDITQEVFIKAIVYYHTYDHTKAIRPWLYKIMLNRVHTVMRKQTYNLPLEMIWNHSTSENIEDFILRDEANRELWISISKLSLKIREVLYMHYYLDMKLEDIAEILEIPIGTCKSRLHTGITRLRKHEQTSVIYLRRERQIE